MNENNNSIIYFYDVESNLVKKEHIFLNNFDPSPFLDDQNLTYATVEHYYQVIYLLQRLINLITLQREIILLKPSKK